MKIIHLRGIKLMNKFKIQGMVLYPFVLFASRDPDEHLRNHERIHVEQIERDGVLRFYSQYLLEYLSLRMKKMSHDEAYRNISYEKEAYEHHNNIQYQVAARR